MICCGILRDSGGSEMLKPFLPRVYLSRRKLGLGQPQRAKKKDFVHRSPSQIRAERSELVFYRCNGFFGSLELYGGGKSLLCLLDRVGRNPCRFCRAQSPPTYIQSAQRFAHRTAGGHDLSKSVLVCNESLEERIPTLRLTASQVF